MLEQREHPYSSESGEEMLAMHQTSIYKSWDAEMLLHICWGCGVLEHPEGMALDTEVVSLMISCYSKSNVAIVTMYWIYCSPHGIN